MVSGLRSFDRTFSVKCSYDVLRAAGCVFIGEAYVREITIGTRVYK